VSDREMALLALGFIMGAIIVSPWGMLSGPIALAGYLLIAIPAVVILNPLTWVILFLAYCIKRM